MNLFLDIWATTMWRACWQGGLVVVAVWTICRLLPSMPARFQCWLWRLAILKFMVVLLVPWFFNLPLLPAQRRRNAWRSFPLLPTPCFITSRWADKRHQRRQCRHRC